MNKDHWLQLITNHRQTDAVVAPHDAIPRLAKLNRIRAVVFDIYGTLFSSGVGDISLATEANRDAVLKSVLQANGLTISTAGAPARFDDALHAMIRRHQSERRNAGIAYPEVEIRAVWIDFIQELASHDWIERGFEADIETLIIDYESRVNPTQAMPGLATTLAALRSRGIVTSIISNAQFYTPLLFEAHLKQDLKALGFSTDCAVWSFELLEAKPSTRLYEIAAEQLQQHHDIQPDEVLYVGNDLRNDIWPAQQVGFNTALFAGDQLSLRRRADDPNCKDIHATLEITELSQLFECL